MGVSDIEKYIDQTVRVNYSSKGELHSRTGVMTAISLKRIALLLFVDDSEDDEEISIPIKNVKRIYRLKAID